MALSALGVVAYYFASSQVNWQPPEEKFDGWLAVLESSKANWDGQVNLTVASDVEEATGGRPVVAYAVAACGTKPFRGVLLVGGNARMSDAEIVGATSSVSAKPEQLHGLTITDLAGRRSLDKRDVQLIRLEIAEPPPCLQSYTASRPLPPFQKGGAVRVVGHPMAPVRYSSPELFGWDGPRSTQLWPLVGGLPSVPFDFATTFPVGVDGLEGGWMRPAQSYFTVVAGPLDSTALVANIRPEPVSSQTLSWRDVQPIRASAEIVDTAAMGRWQQVVVITSLAVGALISLVTSFVFGWIGPRD